MTVGEEGFLTQEKAVQIIKMTSDEGLPEAGVQRIGMEVRPEKNIDPWKIEENCRFFLQRAQMEAENL
jgi:hypothetical protein